MPDLVLAVNLPGSWTREGLLLARSLRTYGGSLADCPLWMFLARSGDHPAPALDALDELGVRRVGFDVPQPVLDFPFGAKVHAAAAAEALAGTDVTRLAWIDPDTVFLDEPSGFLIPDRALLGYRPVMLRNVSSIHDLPPDDFWAFLYDQCGTPAERLFAMETTVDRVRIRAQFNAGLLVVHPETGLLHSWQAEFARLYDRPEMQACYRRDPRYAIFVHQAVLAAAVLARLEPHACLDLGLRYNQPPFLDPLPGETTSGPVTIRYDDPAFFGRADWRSRLAAPPDRLDWLARQVEALGLGSARGS